MKWRNQLLALFCLVVFFAFGVFYFRYWVIQKPFGIILFIGEELDAKTLTAARLAAGPHAALAIDSLGYTALLKNNSADEPLPDAAAAASALATGVKGANGAVAIDAAGKPIANLFDLAREAGRATGLITDDSVTSPTAASFYAHGAAADNGEEFARQLVESAGLDVVLGEGTAEFLPPDKDGHRADQRDLLTTAREADYTFVQTREELENVPRWPRAKLLGLFAKVEPVLPAAGENAPSLPTLPDLVRRGIELLQFHRGGYLLVVDVAAIRRAHAQDGDAAAAALELDRAISVALRYTGTKSAIILCGDLVTNKPPPPPPEPTPTPTPPEPSPTPVRPVYVLAPETSPPEADISAPSPTPPLIVQALPSPSPAPDMTPVEGGTPDPSPPLAEVAVADSSPSPSPPEKPAAIPEDVLAFGSGLGVETLHGTLENTAVFEIIRDNL